MPRYREIARIRKKTKKAAALAKITLMDPGNKEQTGRFQVDGRFAIPCPVCRQLTVMPTCIGKRDIMLIAIESSAHATMLTYSMCTSCRPVGTIQLNLKVQCPLCKTIVGIPKFYSEKKVVETIGLFLLARAWCPKCFPRPDQRVPEDPSGVVPPSLPKNQEEVVAPGEDKKCS